MSFIWPQMLVLLLGAPLLVWAYLGLVHRRQRRAAELAAQGFVANRSDRRMRTIRHLPFVFFLAALIFLLLAFARPEVSVGLPHREGTVILAFDVSNSMLAKDLQPTRLDAAKAAARTFVEKQPDTIQIGIVAFSDGGFVAQQPTNAKTDVLAAIDRLSPMGGTSLGQGIFTSLTAITGKPIALPPDATSDQIDNLDIGYYGSAAIVLLSDGENTSQPDALDVAHLAAVAGVKIYPIGIGSPEGAVVQINGFSIATSLDEDLLKQIAMSTDGTYYNAQDAASLSQIYSHIDLKTVTDAKKTEVTALVTGISTFFLLVGGAVSLVWFGRLV
jgi:Ca-activated chloride channel family protein